MSNAISGIEGITHPCYVVDAILEGIGERVITAIENEAVMVKVVEGMLGSERHETVGALAFNGVPEKLPEEAAKYVADQGGCDSVRTGKCPLVPFLVSKVVEDY